VGENPDKKIILFDSNIIYCLFVCLFVCLFARPEMFVYLPLPLSLQESVEYIPDALDEIPRKAYDNIPEEFHKYMFIAVMIGFLLYEISHFVSSTYPK